VAGGAGHLLRSRDESVCTAPKDRLELIVGPDRAVAVDGSEHGRTSVTISATGAKPEAPHRRMRQLAPLMVIL